MLLLPLLHFLLPGKSPLETQWSVRLLLLAALLLMSILAPYPANAQQKAPATSATKTTGQPASVLRPAPVDSLRAFGDVIKSRYPHGTHTFVLADVTGDGRLDIVAPTLFRDSVMVLPGAGGGKWQPTRYYLACKAPEAIAVADLNDDGRPDLVLSSYVADNVAVLLSQPGGQFDPPAFYPVRHGNSVALADVTGDGRRDIIIGGSEKITVLRGLGKGRFGPGIEKKVEFSSYSLVVADLNGDGRPDLVTASGYSVSVLMGQGDGTFDPAVGYDTPKGSQGLAVGDLNLDGKPDIVMANKEAGSLSVMLGLGNGLFGGRQDYPVGPKPRNVVLADVTGDGYLDLLTGGFGDKALVLLASRGGGRFERPWALPVDDAPWAVVMGDVTGDGIPDAVMMTQYYTIAVLPGLLRTRRATPMKPGAAALSTRVAITGINPASGAPGTLLTLTGTNLNGATSVAFTGPSAAPQTEGLQVSTDGTTLTGLFVPDGVATGPLVVKTPAGPATSSGALVVPPTLRLVSHSPSSSDKAIAPGVEEITLVFDQPPAASSLANIVVTGSQYGGRRSVGAPIVNGTRVVLPLLGRPFGPGERVRVKVPPTVQAASGDAATPFIFEFTTAVVPSSGRFGPAVTYAVDKRPTSLAVADITGDGLPDLLTVNENKSPELEERRQGKKYVGSLTVWVGQPNGRFGGRRNYPMGKFPSGLTLADLDGDGLLDIVTRGGYSYAGAHERTILLSRPEGFEEPNTNEIPSGQFLGPTDADGDGLPELFRADGKWQVYKAEGARYGETPNDIVAGRRLDISRSPDMFQLMDFTGNGRLDIVETTSRDTPPTSLGEPTKLTSRIRPGLPGGRFGAAFGRQVVAEFPTCGEVTGDSYPDLVANTLQGVLVYPGSATGFEPALPLTGAPADATGTSLLADMNGDGLLDLVAITRTGYSVDNPVGAVQVHLGQPHGRFGASVSFPVTMPHRVAVADVNADGRLDIIVASYFANIVSVLLGQP